MTVLLVTGSRHGHAHVRAVLGRWVASRGAPSLAILGDEPRGVDAQAYAWCVEHGYEYVVHPAMWRRYGASAGPKRNLTMNQHGRWSAPECVAFPVGDARGTRNCMGFALAYGYRVYEVDALGRLAG